MAAVAQWLTIWLQWLKHMATVMTFFLIVAVIMTAAAAAAAAEQMGIWHGMRDE